MRLPFRTSLIALVVVTGLDVTAAGTGAAVAQNSQQGSQQDKLNLNSSQQQTIKQGLADQPAHNVPEYNWQIGDKSPSSETAQRLPNDVQDQVPAAKQMLFVKLPDRILLVDPDTQIVAEIIMDQATTGSGSGTPSADSPSR
jgi:hypothetical protein